MGSVLVNKHQIPLKNQNLVSVEEKDQTPRTYLTTSSKPPTFNFSPRTILSQEININNPYPTHLLFYPYFPHIYPSIT